MSADKGKADLPQIKAAYQALNEANANKLICAVRLGDVLNQPPTPSRHPMARALGDRGLR